MCMCHGRPSEWSIGTIQCHKASSLSQQELIELIPRARAHSRLGAKDTEVAVLKIKTDGVRM